jgi:hypothetical protein
MCADRGAGGAQDMPLDPTGGAAGRPRCAGRARRSTGRCPPTRPRPGPRSRGRAGRRDGRWADPPGWGGCRAAAPVGAGASFAGVARRAAASAGSREGARPQSSPWASSVPPWESRRAARLLAPRSPSERRRSRSLWAGPTRALGACHCDAGAVGGAARPGRLRGVRRSPGSNDGAPRRSPSFGVDGRLIRRRRCSENPNRS